MGSLFIASALLKTRFNYFLANQLGWAYYCVQFIIKRSVLKENRLSFGNSIYYEDVIFVVQLLACVKRVSLFDVNAYYYLQRSGSITKSIDLKSKNKIINDINNHEFIVLCATEHT
jgi:hypothetical protein